mmetsp:Transcript_38428/g.78428  ORF Transcript_38428/g.78428 Transcript_38428/m.78428 type:complete len:816 (-) Transcript_38428:537-2984(-)
MKADWPQIDAAAVSATADLFGGDLFGDELMDMYNSSAVVGGDGAHGGTIDAITADIPTLGMEDHHPNTAASTTTAKPTSVPSNSDAGGIHPGAQVAMEAAALDLDGDGFGAFRPSTSFNDFGTLLIEDPSSTAPEDATSKAAAGAAAASASASSTSKGAKNGKDGAKSSTSAAAGAGKAGGPSKGTKKRSRPSSSPAKGGKDDSSTSSKKKKTATSKKSVATNAAPTSTIVHPISPTTVSRPTSAPKKGTKASAAAAAAAASKANANGKGVCNPLTPGSKAAVAGGALAKSGPASAAAAAATAAANAKTMSTARRLVGSPDSNRPKSAPIPSAAPSSTTAAGTSAAAVKAAAAAKAAASPSSSLTASSATTAKSSKDLTENDFRGVAQAAVKNLMMAVGGTKSGTVGASAPTSSTPAAGGKPTSTASSLDSKKPVNITSSHIAALTSSNWVQACSEGVGDAAQAAALAAAAAANDPAQSKAARARRANLTPDERARQNRDRNREHARNTRLRKKAYVEELKKTLTELVAQRDASELERRHEAQRDLEVREVRFRVMEEFLKLRSQGDNTTLLTRWVAIMEDGFTLTLPHTDFRPSVNGQTSMRRVVSVDGGAAVPEPIEQVLKGAPEVMQDAAHLSAFVNTFGHASQAAGPVRFAYHCERKNFMMDGINAILHWTASTSGAVARGAPSELVVKGMMRANFSPASNKLNSVELLFDAGSVAHQAKNLITTPTVVTTSQILDMPSVADSSVDVDSETNALLDSLEMPLVPSTTSGTMSKRVSTASLEEERTPTVSSGDESEGATSRGPTTRRSARVH